MVPLSGRADDRVVLNAAAAVAAPFAAEVAGVFAPPDIADLAPWMSDGMVGGAEIAAIEAVKNAGQESLTIARGHLNACAAENKTFVALTSPVLPKLALEGRLADIVVFDQTTACGRTRLSQSFQDLVAAEQRPAIVVKDGFAAPKTVLVAWNGGKEASRAARTALPLLQKAERVVVLTADESKTREIDPARLVDFLSQRGVACESRRCGKGDAATSILTQAAEIGAQLIVVGAFGHTRLREYVLGGATRDLLNAAGPSLFLSH